MAEAKPVSVWIALRPHPHDALLLAVKDGLPASRLHLTLAYVAPTGDSMKEERETAKRVARELASETPAFTARLGAVKTFNDPRVHYVAILSAPRVVRQLRAEFEADLSIDRTHEFVPHITLKRGGERPRRESLFRTIRFDAIVVHCGDEAVVFNLCDR